MSTIHHTEPAPTLEEVWRLFKETDRKFQETERFIREQREENERLMKERAQETERFIKEQREENERLMKERAQETERFIKEQREENERLMKERAQETERLIKEQREENQFFIKSLSLETNKKIASLGNRLGEFVESFVTPALIKLFQTRGIEVYGLSRDISRHHPKLNLATQIDLFAVNGDTCILIEVKSKFSIDDVNEHLERMDKFKPLFPEYADKKAYGAVAAMVMSEEVAKYAYRKGFFVLAQQGETVAILNDEKFKPVAW